MEVHALPILDWHQRVEEWVLVSSRNEMSWLPTEPSLLSPPSAGPRPEGTGRPRYNPHQPNPSSGTLNAILMPIWCCWVCARENSANQRGQWGDGMGMGFSPSGTLKTCKVCQAQETGISAPCWLGKHNRTLQTAELTMCPWLVHGLSLYSINKPAFHWKLMGWSIYVFDF